MRAVVETPIGSEVKYLLNKENAELWVSRTLQNNTCFPANYGFFPKTLEEDGDPLDCFIVGPILLPHTNIDVTILGGIEVTDDRGRDTKLICCPVGHSSRVSTEQLIENIRQFLGKYKYDHEKVVVGENLDAYDAEVVYENAVKAYLSAKAQEEQLVKQLEEDILRYYGDIN